MDLQVIEILNLLFWICLIFAIVFFALAVVQFFVFDIKGIFDKKTGRAQAKAIKEMEAVNESTGRLRKESKPHTSKLSESEKLTKRAPAVVPPSPESKNNYYDGNSSAEGANETDVLVSPDGSSETDVLRQPDYNEAETDVLNQPQYSEAETSVLDQPQYSEAETSVLDQPSSDEAETSVLSNNNYTEAETSVLSQDMADGLAAGDNAKAGMNGFRIVKKVVLVHTKEFI